MSRNESDGRERKKERIWSDKKRGPLSLTSFSKKQQPNWRRVRENRGFEWETRGGGWQRLAREGEKNGGWVGKDRHFARGETREGWGDRDAKIFSLLIVSLFHEPEGGVTKDCTPLIKLVYSRGAIAQKATKKEKKRQNDLNPCLFSLLPLRLLGWFWFFRLLRIRETEIEFEVSTTLSSLLIIKAVWERHASMSLWFFRWFSLFSTFFSLFSSSSSLSSLSLTFTFTDCDEDDDQ